MKEEHTYQGQFKYVITNNQDLFRNVQKGMKKKAEKYGHCYCPCSLVNDEDHICMCKEFREASVGTTCHCGIYTKIADL